MIRWYVRFPPEGGLNAFNKRFCRHHGHSGVIDFRIAVGEQSSAELTGDDGRDCPTVEPLLGQSTSNFVSPHVGLMAVRGPHNVRENQGVQNCRLPHRPTKRGAAFSQAGVVNQDHVRNPDQALQLTDFGPRSNCCPPKQTFGEIVLATNQRFWVL